MRGCVGRWRGRIVAPAVALSILGAAIAPAATPSQAQVWGPWGPLPGWDTDFPGPLPGPMPGPLVGPGPLPGPVPGPLPAVGPTESRALAPYLRVLRSISRGNGADATSVLADDATYWVSDGVGNCSATPCLGRASIGPEFERQIGQRFRYAPLGGDVVGSVGGSSITGLWDIRSDRVTAAGSERLLGTITSEVRNDRIASMRLTLVRDDPQTQRFLAWLASQGSGAAAPTTPFAAPSVVPTVVMPPSAP